MIHAFYKWVFVCLLVILAGMAEMAFGFCNVFVPVLMLCAFYLFVVHAWWGVVLPIALAGMVMDSAYGRPLVLSLVMVAASAVMSRLWLRFGGRKRYLPLFVPGMVCGLISWVSCQGAEMVRQGDWLLLLSFDAVFAGTLQAVFFSGLACVVVCRLADGLAFRCELPMLRVQDVS